jgi:glutamyl-tRNA synthetase
MILGPDRSRLSKRHGATAVQAFRDEGVLPDAMVNYLARLGWSHGDQEIFSRQELVERFDIKDVAASGAVFDRAKLEWLSHEYLKRTDGPALVRMAWPFLQRAGVPVPDDHARLAAMLTSLRERAKTLVELVEAARFYLERPREFEARAAGTLFTAEGGRRLSLLVERLQGLDPFTPEALEAAVRALAAELGLKLVDLAQLARLAVTGRTASPPIFEVLALLGREETLARLRAVPVAAGP